TGLAAQVFHGAIKITAIFKLAAARLLDLLAGLCQRGADGLRVVLHGLGEALLVYAQCAVALAVDAYAAQGFGAGIVQGAAELAGGNGGAPVARQGTVGIGAVGIGV